MTCLVEENYDYLHLHPTLRSRNTNFSVILTDIFFINGRETSDDLLYCYKYRSFEVRVWDISAADFLCAEIRLRSLYAVARPSVVCMYVCLSVTFVRPIQPVEIVDNFSTPFGTLAIHWNPSKIFTEMVPGNPSVGGVKCKRGSQILYSDFGPIEGYISETVKDRR